MTAWEENDYVYKKEPLPRATGRVPLSVAPRSIKQKKDPYGSYLDDLDFIDEKENSSYDLYLKKQ